MQRNINITFNEELEAFNLHQQRAADRKLFFQRLLDAAVFLASVFGVGYLCFYL